MRRNLFRILVGLLVGLGLTVAVESPVQAVTGYDRCDWTYVCLFTGTHGSGSMYRHIAVGGTCLNTVGGAIDSADSFANKRLGNVSHHVQFYRDVNCGGPLLAAVPTGSGNTGPFPGGYQANFARGDENKVSSIWFNTG